MQGALVYITGLSGSGKTTLAKEVVKGIKSMLGVKPIFLDGDALRECVVNSDYSTQGRFNMASYYVRVAKLLVEQDFIVVLSTISMFEKVRAFNVENFKNYLEVYLEVSEEIRKTRDPKNFYKCNTEDMAGLNQNVELPRNSHLVFKDNFDMNSACKEILDKLKGF
ncbi:adenylyl-sulfate kinase [Helicobacter turcicus]|uniref:Adenylyl-sulfate kinase n=1 Tax=Helicobacter turcicus TaxID=2867412 RepID=A0ABS7JQ22_9HELI|nr:adenylyl-sulfate kinase [Helicobacter turcicus]MBX7491488.1 adenylyl-sulfate kinase [Helicobacter turcicus]MBX7546344.1 adenylyl-sulfate kinase [Helicobacter turcicus]